MVVQTDHRQLRGFLPEYCNRGSYHGRHRKRSACWFEGTRILTAYPERGVRELLGLSILPPFIGYVDGQHPRRILELNGPAQKRRAASPLRQGPSRAAKQLGSA
jgi:hypothetical protein